MTSAPRLPPEKLHLPFETGPYRMAMGLVALPESAWFEIDDRYPAELRERRHLLTERHADVFAALPVSAEARAETLAADCFATLAYDTPSAALGRLVRLSLKVASSLRSSQ